MKYKEPNEDGELMRGKRANSRLDFMTALSDFINEQRLGKCQVFWGRHACNIPRNHGPHQHRCCCNNTPQYYSVLWGDDLTQAEINNRPHCQKDLAAVEKLASYADDFDTTGQYRPNRQRRGIRDDRWKTNVA
jgi:hypothetical protein